MAPVMGKDAEKQEGGLNNSKTRASLMGIVGGYLIYLAWQLYQGRTDPDTTMTPAAMILFISLFVLAGAGLIVYAFRLWKHGMQEDQEKRREEEQNIMK